MKSDRPSLFQSGQITPAGPRRRILEATIRVIGHKGYGDATVGDLLAESGVSRTAFHAHFAGKHDCFLAAYEVALEHLFEEIAVTCDPAAPWEERMRNGLRTILRRFAADPTLGRMIVVEAAVAGPDGLRHYFDALTRLGEYLLAGRAVETESPPPEHMALMSVGGIAGVIANELAAGRAARLPELLPGLLFTLLLPFVGTEAAAVEMRRAGGY